MGLIAFPPTDATQRGLCHPRKRMTQHKDPGGCSSILPCLCPKPRSPDSPRATPVCTALPSLKPQVSGCKHNSVHWPCRGRLCLQQTLPVLGRQKPHVFHSQMLCEHLLPALVFWSAEYSQGFRLHTAQGEPPRVELSLCSLSCHPQEPASCLRLSTLPTSLMGVSSASPWL